MICGQPWDVTPWMQPAAYCCEIAKAFGVAVVTWPSGKRTLERYGGNVIVSELELHTARNRDVLKQCKLENLNRTMERFIEDTHRGSFWVRRTGRRPKYRRIVSAEFMPESQYRGPVPVNHSVLP